LIIWQNGASLSTFNYANVLRTGQRLVTKFGRSVTFVQLDAGPDNAAQPWKGTATVRTAPIAELTVNGVFVEPESLERLGLQVIANEFVKSTEQVVIIVTDQSLKQYDELVDSHDGARYKIANIQQLNPGDKIVLHYVRIQRRGHTTAVRGALL
jgi:hypothetical protein